MRILTLTLLLTIALMSSGATAQDVPKTPDPPAIFQQTESVVGVYLCRGVNPDGTTYEGIAEIVRYQEVYMMRWTLPDGIVVFGIGIAKDDMLAVSYDGGAPGIIVYKAEGDDRLVGEWTMGGIGGRKMSETLIRLKDHPPLPEVPAPKPPQPQKQPGKSSTTSI